MLPQDLTENGYEQQQPKPWANKLLAISCFSLAAKMLKTEYSATDVQVKCLCLLSNQFAWIEIWNQSFCKRDWYSFELVLLVTRFLWIMVMGVPFLRHRQFKEWKALSWGLYNGECVRSPPSLSFPSSSTCSGLKTLHWGRFWRMEHQKSYSSHKEVV